MTKDLADKWISEHPITNKLDPKEYSTDSFEIDKLGDRVVEPVEDPVERLRLDRNSILCATDWLMLPDVKLDQKHRKIYIAYRQYLRNCTKGNPESRIEEFSHWLRRNHPEEFMDGGEATKIIDKLKTYLDDKR
jgi:hypothetical protein